MNPKPIDHPSVWRGEEVARRTDFRQELTPDEADQLARFAESDDDERTLPPVFVERLRRIQHDLEQGCGACLATGAPFDRLEEAQARRLFAAVGAVVGRPVSQSAAGETVFSVRDEGYQIGHPQARGPNTKKRLSFHTDRCDVIAFACLHPAATGGENQIVSAPAVFNAILATRPDLLEVLMQPFYYLRHNVDAGNARPWCRQPVFSFCEGRFAACYLRVLIDRAHASAEAPDLTASQQEALDLLDATCADPAMHFTFRQNRGDLLFLNNWVVLHRREEFTDDPDPARRRHLLRMWLSPPNSRPIDPAFADNYGDVRGGVERGGMRPAP